MERAIDQQVLSIQQHPEAADAFIRENEPFIRNCVRHWQNRAGTGPALHQGHIDGEDHIAISMNAFHEAIQTYHFDKGSFYSFAAMVIERRLIDYARREARHFREMPVDPIIFESGGDQEEDIPDKALRLEVVRQLSTEPDHSLKHEIEAANQRFLDYGFSFFDLADSSPKAAKTKQACAAAVNCLLESPVLLKTLQDQGQLPLKSLEKMSGVPRKILERHRKYIIAAAEIVGGDYPHLAQYMSFIRKGNSR